MSITLEQVKYIADLARLDLTEDEEIRFSKQLSAILEHFEELQSVDTTEIDDLSGFQLTEGDPRLDEVRKSLGLEKLLQNASDTDSNQFKIPPVFE